MLIELELWHLVLTVIAAVIAPLIVQRIMRYTVLPLHSALQQQSLETFQQLLERQDVERARHADEDARKRDEFMNNVTGSMLAQAERLRKSEMNIVRLQAQVKSLELTASGSGLAVILKKFMEDHEK